MSWITQILYSSHTFQDFLGILHIPSLVCGDQTCHRDDLRIVLVPELISAYFLIVRHGSGSRLRLLRVERVDIAPHEHVGKDHILENLYTLG